MDFAWIHDASPTLPYVARPHCLIYPYGIYSKREVKKVHVCRRDGNFNVRHDGSFTIGSTALKEPEGLTLGKN